MNQQLDFITEVSARKRKKLLSLVPDRSNALGIEIGALDNPSIIKAEGPVIYVDYADTATLKAKYAGTDRGERVVDVDAIWGEATLAEAIGSRGPADYVVASHVIEHVPDLVTWLKEIHQVLKTNGTLHLVIPDRRYTFDVRREPSRLSDVVYAHLVKARKPLPHQLLDFEMHHMDVDRGEAWSKTLQIPQRLDRSKVERAMQIVHQTTISGEYYDTHCWVFTPTSFSLLMEALCNLGLFSFQCESWFDTERNEVEFVVIMRKSDDQAACMLSWEKMTFGLRQGWPFGP